MTPPKHKISLEWDNTLRFLSGTLGKKGASELIKTMSDIFLDVNNPHYRKSLDSILQCTLESQHTRHMVQEMTEQLKPRGLISNIKKSIKYMLWPVLTITGLGIAGGAYYWKQEQIREIEELLTKGKSECEEIKYSPELIECFRYYTHNKEGKIRDLGYQVGFHPLDETAIQEEASEKLKIKKRVVWELKSEDCSLAYNDSNAVKLYLGPKHRWEFDYQTGSEAEKAAEILERFCKKKVTDEEEETCPEFEEEESDSSGKNKEIELASQGTPQIQELEQLLKKGRTECDSISYSPEKIKCEYYDEFMVDEEGNRLYESYSGTDIQPPGIVDGMDRDDGLTNCPATGLVWELSSADCLRFYDAGYGGAIMELKDGRVMEFRGYEYKSKVELNKVLNGLEEFCLNEE